jgi:small-conductance mechanosensitive channel
MITASLWLAFQTETPAASDTSAQSAQASNATANPPVNLLDDFIDIFERVWQMQLTVVDDQPITIGKIIIAGSLLIAGFVIARFISGFVSKTFLSKLSMTENSRAMVQRLTSYAFALIFAMVTLDFLGVPLTIFTLLGGALAIGIGFGSQNLMNNFISGLIILVERPIRIGDVIQMDNVSGTIMEIGGRSTKIRDNSNVEIIVPNSKFLESNVINWTFSDDRIRTKVSVGYAYGSDTAMIKATLVQAAKAHPKILNTPDPIVLFHEFGDNALVFEVRFWINMKSQMERMIIESELRFEIDRLCRERNLVIAFPQRDVHLDTLSPLQVEVTTK